MGYAKHDTPEEEVKRWLNHIALICLSEEFQSLKRELESLYLKSNIDNVRLAAFQDALYAFLVQEEDEKLINLYRNC
ncbi:hypothetical protein [Desulforamulus hydrothermalis]|uniref:PH domain-containing protein n=1 Tax=Desulforamulus hydrothermalis Lam5 = DSM 18033 TaxID=1121428 RepID=K8E149_9FIRM|nr:hypothetical protein [Desulforamulus hydrothermalis]CCO09419.1 conserved hypothetical protein [Desulforamulus hydrothermalis Lam5 = DSM 18033]SHH08553.1 hypothetical protein SAMN02745177_01386 [Desulforamulus hydrothermalis Lam5 = DSM 18033]